jgi:hypothetical protein
MLEHWISLSSPDVLSHRISRVLSISFPAWLSELHRLMHTEDLYEKHCTINFTISYV